MRHAWCALLVLAMGAQSAMAAPRLSVREQVDALPLGKPATVRLKSKQTLRGILVNVSDSSITLMVSRVAKTEIAIGDVAWARQLQPHVARTMLIGVGLIVAGVSVYGSMED